jgi:hypothetical protein
MKKALAIALPLLAMLGTLTGAPTESLASDHVDGLKTALDNAADLTDLYTFVSPKDPQKLVMVLNVHGIASSMSRFSNAVDYKFRIRPIDDAKKLVPSADARREQSMVCSFSGGIPFIDANQHATCTFNFGSTKETVTFDTRSNKYTAGGDGAKNGIRVFAGVRSDTWFLDGAKTLKYVYTNEPVSQAAGHNLLEGQNVLSIVVEVDKARLAAPLLAITAQTVRK